ncbi:membrane protein [Cryptosporangium aurantiacum]|uniref:Membrane protein n=1 Tax=Cryptosporangium aurantiacum TaxID=134849 RepID=A0A1M7RH52_9ACTN|nr:YhjD/YihY/BrkB family envelope integrity protein [Cryptosporangium aurantiacum]SHN45479.1 membrane protein [Cryptosporangium aurantiacum]
MADRFVAFPWVPTWVVRPVRRARQRWRWFDTMIRAAVRFDEVNGGRLAAAISFYAFLAVFPLGLLSFSILGYLLSDDAALTARVELFLRENIPGLPVTAIADARNTAGVIGVLGFLYAGLRWVDVVRSSVRAIWRRNEMPNNIFMRTINDLLALMLLGAALLFSVGGTVALSGGLDWLLGATGQEGETVGDTTTTILAFLAGMLVNIVAFVGFLAGLPRLRMSFRRVIGPALLGAIGLELLKTVGRVFINRTEANPAYAVVAGTVGLLVFLHLFDQLLLYCAALTATAQRGGAVIDRGAPGDQLDAGTVSADRQADADGPAGTNPRTDAVGVRPAADEDRTGPDRAPVVVSAEVPPARPDAATAPTDVVARPGSAPAGP